MTFQSSQPYKKPTNEVYTWLRSTYNDSVAWRNDSRSLFDVFETISTKDYQMMAQWITDQSIIPPERIFEALNKAIRMRTEEWRAYRDHVHPACSKDTHEKAVCEKSTTAHGHQINALRSIFVVLAGKEQCKERRFRRKDSLVETGLAGRMETKNGNRFCCFEDAEDGDDERNAPLSGEEDFRDGEKFGISLMHLLKPGHDLIDLEESGRGTNDLAEAGGQYVGEEDDLIALQDNTSVGHNSTLLPDTGLEDVDLEIAGILSRSDEQQSSDLESLLPDRDNVRNAVESIIQKKDRYLHTALFPKQTQPDPTTPTQTPCKLKKRPSKKKKSGKKAKESIPKGPQTFNLEVMKNRQKEIEAERRRASKEANNARFVEETIADMERAEALERAQWNRREEGYYCCRRCPCCGELMDP